LKEKLGTKLSASLKNLN